MRYKAARDFDTARASVPTSIVSGIFGGRFAEKQYFTAMAGGAEGELLMSRSVEGDASCLGHERTYGTPFTRSGAESD